MPRMNAGGAAPNARMTHGGHLTMITLFFVLAELGLWVWCMWQQITTTHDSIFGLLQGGTLVPTHLTPQQVVTFLQGAADKDHKIAYTIAFVTQIVFLSCFLPGGPIHNPTLRRIVVAIFFILEVTSDLWYSAATGTTIGGAFTWVFNWNDGGWLASLTYIVAMTAGSTLLGIDGFHRLERMFKELKAIAASQPATK